MDQATATLSFYEYQDDEGHLISFKFLPKGHTSWEEHQELFVASVRENFRGISPHMMKSHSKSDPDVTDWLQDAFKEEVHYFKASLHPVSFINVFKGKNLIGFAIIEQWNDEATTLHIRQIAIAPRQGRNGYGTALVNAIKTLPKGEVRRVIADTRKIYERARWFYKKLGFKELDTPHNPELIGTGNYIGLEWKP